MMKLWRMKKRIISEPSPSDPFISLYWGLGGKQLHKMWVNEVVLPQYKMGNLGLPATMPFK